MKTLFGVSWAVLSMAFLASVPARAQDAQEGQQTQPGDTSGQLQDIVVTAERKSTSAQRVPSAIAIIGADAANEKIAEPQNLTNLVPALNIAMGGSGNTQVSIRGVGSLSGNPYAEQAVASSLDGIYISRPAAVGAVLFDLERVEVVKGPQGTLYGRNATAGAINFISAKPSFQAGGSFSVNIGNYAQRKVDAAVNVPLSDTVAVRIAGQTAAHDGYFSDGYGDLNNKGLRGSILIEPSSSLKINASLDYADIDSKGAGSIVSSSFDPNNPYNGASTAAANAPYVAAGIRTVKDDGYLRAHFFGGSGSIEWDTGAGKLSIIPGFRHSVIDALTYTPGFPLTSSETSDMASVETRFASPDEKPFSYIIGAYAYQEKQKFNILANLTTTFSDTHISKLDTTSLAAFAQGMLRIGDSTRLTAGIRYTRDKKTVAGTVASPLPDVPSFLYSTVCASPGTYAATTTPGVDSVTGNSCTIPVEGAATFKKATWRVVLEHDLTPDNMLYANVGTGFKAGGFYSSQAPNTFKPENMTAYAVGSKNRFFDRHLQLNVEAYYWDYRNSQVSHLGPVQPSGFDLITENAGKAEIYGAEAELVWQAGRNTRFGANLQYQHSRYKSFIYSQETTTGAPTTSCLVTPISGQAAVTVDCSGRTLAKTPKWSGNVSFSQGFELPGGLLTASVFERFSSRYWLGEEYLADEYQKAFHVTDLELSYALDAPDITISAYVDNVEDKAIKATAFAEPTR